MAYIFFDTETTGFAKNGVQPRIIQIAWQVADENGNQLNSCSSLIKPDGWEVPKEKFWIENGHSTERCEEHGQEIEIVLGQMFLDINRFNCHTIVAHNLGYDAPVLASEMNKLGWRSHNKLKKICTMLSANHLFGKWPKLIELYKYLFNDTFEGAHDALADVNACAKCFFKMKELNIQLKFK